ncbi:L-gulonolactone oxidase [Cryptotermes secundus]|uniref:L-gulonolactone oxidase n=1 Tax=Cryptotermes secundus TaxID=105785 RepID=UPI000CD7C4CE|nr:L-gulonolactone oxidase [Cryptotermes secundus]
MSTTEVSSHRMQIFHPYDAEDIQKIICEARENGLTIKYYGGSFPVSKEGVDIVIKLDNMRRFIFYDPEEQTFTFEGGLTISEVLQSMEYLNYTLELYGIIPDMTVADAVSVGLMGSNGTIAHCLKSCQVIHADGALIDWVWPTPEEVSNRSVNIPTERHFLPTLQTVVCGLGVFGIVSTATFKCIPIHLAQETVFECPLNEMVNNWQQLLNGLYSYMYWYPLLDKVIIKRASSVRLRLGHLQPWWKKCMEVFYWSIHWVVNRASPYLAWYAPSFSKKLSKAQFSLVMKASSCRMQHTFRPQLLISVASYCKGIKWSLPADKLQSVIEDIGIWSKHRFYLCSTPILIAVQTHQAPSHHPYLSPYTERKTCTLWTDWFNSRSITSSYSATMAEFEALLQKNGGRKCWSAGPVYASPLIGQMYPGFRQWCETRTILDPTNMLRSGYVVGDLLVKG